MKKRKRLKLKGIIKDLHLDVHEATSILHKRTDLGVFHGQEINTLQLGALIDYAKNRTNVDKKSLNDINQKSYCKIRILYKT